MAESRGTASRARTLVAALGLVALVAVLLAASAQAGTVGWSWGRGSSGELGDGATTLRSVPGQISALTEIKQLAGGENFAVALLDDGTVESWGAGTSGELGDGTSEGSDVPVPVAGLEHVVEVAAAGRHALALLADGTVVAWGAGEDGQLGDGEKLASDVPVPVANIDDATAIAAGTAFALVALSDGQVKSWGDGAYGALGDNSTESSSLPVTVEGVTTATAVAAGYSHAIALLAGGEAAAWGENVWGEVGNGQSGKGTRSVKPVPVPGIDGAVAVAAGGYHTAALLSSGYVSVWGGNEAGEVGNGESGKSLKQPTPTFAEVRGVRTIASGAFDMYAAGVPESGEIMVQAVTPDEGPDRGGTEVKITGIDLGEVEKVDFGAAPASSFTVNSGTSITAVSPPVSQLNEEGYVDVTVVGPQGYSATSNADLFEYEARQPAPVIRSVAPDKGPASGGTTVTITGEHFKHVEAVKFGAQEAQGYTVESGDRLTVVSPPGSTGKVSVTVIANGAANLPSNKAHFDYSKPTIAHVEPGEGPQAGGNTVTIAGAGFDAGDGLTQFAFGSSRVAAECASTELCTVTAPAASGAGTVKVTAFVGAAKSKKNAAAVYTYE